MKTTKKLQEEKDNLEKQLPDLKTLNLNGQVEKSKTSEISKISEIFSKFFKSEFWVLVVGQNQKLGNKKTRNNFSEISKIFDLSEFLVCHIFIFFLNFLPFFINIFSNSLIYICIYSSTLYNIISLTKHDFLCLCFDL